MPVVLYSTSVPVTIKLKHEILRVKRMLECRKIEYEEVDVAVDFERRKEMEADDTGAKKLPQLFIDGKYIGDAEELLELEEIGELDGILKGEAS